jgi:hypothetical protein
MPDRLVFRAGSGGRRYFIYGAPVNFLLLLSMPVVTLAAAGAATGLTVRAGRGSGAGLTARIHQVALLVGLAARVGSSGNRT